MANDIAVLEKQFDPLLPKFAQVLEVPGINLPAPRLVRSILISCERTPKLLDCTRQSLFNAAMSAACLGLECDGVTGQAFLIPFSVKGTPAAQLVIGYKGYNTLAARSGYTITGEVVREGDAFDFDEGEGWVKHKKKLDGPPNRKIVAVWSKAAALSRPPIVKVLSIADIIAVKAKSPGARKGDSPWNDPEIGFPAMSEKTAKRRLGRGMPLNVMQYAARMEEAFDEQGLVSYITPERGVVVEASAVVSAQPSVDELVDTDTLAPPPESMPADQPSTATRLKEFDVSLAEAAKLGIVELEAAWWTIPLSYRISLQSALNRRHKPAALAADQEKDHNEARKQ
jgi:phage RecT family recombinase